MFSRPGFELIWLVSALTPYFPQVQSLSILIGLSLPFYSPEKDPLDSPPGEEPLPRSPRTPRGEPEWAGEEPGRPGGAPGEPAGAAVDPQELVEESRAEMGR